MEKSETSDAATGVFIGPLLPECSLDQLSQNIFRLLINIGLRCSDISKISINSSLGYAKVRLNTQEAEDYLVHALQEVHSLMNVYDLRDVTINPANLRIARIRGPKATDIKAKVHDSTVAVTSLCDDSGVICSPHHHPPISPNMRTDQGDLSAQLSLSSLQEEHGIAMPDDTSDKENGANKSPEQISSKPGVPDPLQTAQDIQLTTKDTHQRDGHVSDAHLDEGVPETTGLAYSSDSSESTIVREFERLLEEEQDSTVEAPNLADSSPAELVKRTPPSEDEVQQGQEEVSQGQQTPFQHGDRHVVNDVVLTADELFDHGTSERPAKPMLVNAKTSTPKVAPCSCPETVFYHRLQHLGTETRHAEFKKGGMVGDRRAFVAMVGRYACGFLNSGGGTLYLGVNDDGVVLGIDADARLEAILREDVRQAVAHITPEVSASEYVVHFVRVEEPGGHVLQDLKVLEMCVYPRLPLSTVFAYKGAVYMRRDGSLQLLHAADRRNKT